VRKSGGELRWLGVFVTVHVYICRAGGLYVGAAFLVQHALRGRPWGRPSLSGIGLLRKLDMVSLGNETKVSGLSWKGLCIFDTVYTRGNIIYNDQTDY
jgi:hypothetical protein